jgi:hypothetical protein
LAKELRVRDRAGQFSCWAARPASTSSKSCHGPAGELLANASRYRAHRIHRPNADLRGATLAQGARDVNRSSEIREFLVSRRARIIPQQAGLPLYGTNRRVKGLRREEVAMLAGVSVNDDTRLERGNLAGASESVLDALAARCNWRRVVAAVRSRGQVSGCGVLDFVAAAALDNWRHWARDRRYPSSISMPSGVRRGRGRHPASTPSSPSRRCTLSGSWERTLT